MPMISSRNAGRRTVTACHAAIALRMSRRARTIWCWLTRPFPTLQPYAETGPIFLHAEPCARAADASAIPPMLARRKAHLIKGYDGDDRIVYSTGQVVASGELEAEAVKIFERPEVAYVHVRSAVNNCFTCRIDRD